MYLQLGSHSITESSIRLPSVANDMFVDRSRSVELICNLVIGAAVSGKVARDCCLRCASGSRCQPGTGSSIRLPAAVIWVRKGRGNNCRTRKCGRWDQGMQSTSIGRASKPPMRCTQASPGTAYLCCKLSNLDLTIPDAWEFAGVEDNSSVLLRSLSMGHDHSVCLSRSRRLRGYILSVHIEHPVGSQ
jgi:hypothetical protein